MMQELDTFEGGSGLVLTLPEPKSYTHDAWEKGINSASGSRSLRIVMPLAMFVDIVEKADLSIFSSEAGGVECWPQQLQYPEQEVCFLHRKTLNSELRCSPMKVTDVQHEVPEGARKIHCKSLELPLNYHQRIIRYAFRVPPKVGERGETLKHADWLNKCSRYIQKWMDRIIAEKKRQMQLPEDMWPPWPPHSTISDVYTMPMVMWLSKAPKEKKPPPPPAAYNRCGNRYMSSGFGMSGDLSLIHISEPTRPY